MKTQFTFTFTFTAKTKEQFYDSKKQVEKLKTLGFKFDEGYLGKRYFAESCRNEVVFEFNDLQEVIDFSREINCEVSIKGNNLTI